MIPNLVKKTLIHVINTKNEKVYKKLVAIDGQPVQKIHSREDNKNPQ